MKGANLPIVSAMACGQNVALVEYRAAAVMAEGATMPAILEADNEGELAHLRLGAAVDPMVARQTLADQSEGNYQEGQCGHSAAATSWWLAWHDVDDT